MEEQEGNSFAFQGQGFTFFYPSIKFEDFMVNMYQFCYCVFKRNSKWNVKFKKKVPSFDMILLM